MKRKLFLIVIILTICFCAFSNEYKQVYEKKNVYKNIFIYMYEIYEGDELVCYRIDTKQRPSYYKYIECTVISEREKDIMKLLSGLVDCYNNDYYKYISEYSGLTFLRDEYSKDLDTITERYCYQIK